MHQRATHFTLASLRGWYGSERATRFSWPVAVLVTVSLHWALQQAIAQAPVSVAAQPWLSLWLELSVAIFAGLCGVLFLLPQRDSWQVAWSVGLVSLFLTGMVSLVLKLTPFTVGGVNGDQELYAVYVNKLAALGGYRDMIYADLPAFYPPLYFYILGRLAAIFGGEPFRIMKYGLLTTVALLPWLSCWSWRRLLDGRLALAGVLALLVGQQWNKPAEWLTMVIFVPWWLHWVAGLNQPKPSSTWRAAQWWLAGAIIGSLIFQSYYYWFFIGGVSLLLHLALPSLLGKADNWHFWRNALMILAGSALFSALYWGPYLYSMYSSGGWQILQNRWLAEGKIALPLPFLELSPRGIFMAAGLIYLVISAAHDQVARHLGWLLAATYGWIALGYVGMVIDMPLLTFRAYPFVDYLLAVATWLALLRLWQVGEVASADAPQPVKRRRVGQALLVAGLLYFGQQSVQALLKDEYVEKALATTVPTGQLAALDQATGGRYAGQTVLLGRDDVELLAYRPLDAFLAWSAHYSHPAGRFYQRLALLEQLTTVQTPALFRLVLQHNRYDQIDYLLLRNDEQGLGLNYLADNFPLRNEQRWLYFSPNVFVAPDFQAKPLVNGTLFVPQAAADQLATLRSLDPAVGPLAEVALGYALARLFGNHLREDISAPWLAAAQVRLEQADLSGLPTSLLLDLRQAADGRLATQLEIAIGQSSPN